MAKSTRAIYQEMLKSKKKIIAETKKSQEQKDIKKTPIISATKELKKTFFSFFTNKIDNYSYSKRYNELIKIKIQTKKEQKADRLLSAMTINNEILNEKNIEQIIKTLKQSINKDSLVYKSLQDMPKQIQTLKNNIFETKKINKNQYKDLQININTEENTLKAIKIIKKLKQQAIEQFKTQESPSAEKLITQMLNLEFLIKSHHEKILSEKNQKTIMEKQNILTKKSQYMQEKKPLTHVQKLKQNNNNQQISK